MTRAANLFGRVPALAWVLLIAAIIHFPALSGGWLWDDHSLIKDVELSLLEIWLKPGALAEYYPLTHSTYWLERVTVGPNPFVAHLVNLAIYLGLGAVLFKLLNRLKVKGAVLGLALFLVHPVNVESVAWASQRKTLLAGLFGLLAVLYYLRWRDDASRRDFGLALACFVLAALSKTQVIMLVAVMPLLDLWRGRALGKSQIIQLWPFGAVALAGAAVTVLMEYRVEAVGEVATLTLFDRILIMGATFVDSLLHVLSPLRHSLVYEPAGDYVSFGYIGLPVALVILVGAFALRKRFPGLFLSVAGAFLFLLPVSGLLYFPYMAFSPAADRFSLFGNMLIIPGLVAWAYTFARSHYVQVALAAWVAFYGFFGFQRSQVFAVEEQTWQATVQRNPKAWIAHENLGLIAKAGGGDGLEHFETAWAMSKDALISANEIATAKLGSGSESDAFAMLDTIIKTRPNDYQAYVTKGVELMARDRDKEALATLIEGLKNSGKAYHEPLLLNLATLLATSKDKAVHNPPEAVGKAEELVRDFGETPLHLFCLGDVQGHAGMPEATATLEKGLKLALEDEDAETEARIRARLTELESR